MIEYLYNAIRATAGKDISIAAKITTESGATLTDICSLMLSNDKGELISSVAGSLVDDAWQFTIPAEITKGLNGRYWYCFCTSDTNLCFKQPIYLV